MALFGARAASSTLDDDECHCQGDRNGGEDGSSCDLLDVVVVR
jgi:hypothetical protein